VSFKTDIWVLGITIMKLFIYSKIKNYSSKNLTNQAALISLKMALKLKIGDKLSNLITEMIKKSPRDRPTFKKLLKSELFLDSFTSLK